VVAFDAALVVAVTAYAYGSTVAHMMRFQSGALHRGVSRYSSLCSLGPTIEWSTYYRGFPAVRHTEDAGAPDMRWCSRCVGILLREVSPVLFGRALGPQLQVVLDDVTRGRWSVEHVAAVLAAAMRSGELFTIRGGDIP
jgi:hypothetical protein